MALSRLRDDDKIAPDKIDKLNTKVTSIMTQLCISNPLVFSVASTRQHYLKRMLSFQSLDTAATDGFRFFWNPEFLEKLTTTEAKFVMTHEVYHVILMHCMRGKDMFKNFQLWNLAIDLIANGIIISAEKTLAHAQNSLKQDTVVMGPTLGTAITFNELIAFLDAKVDFDDTKRCFGDASILDRSSESIYEELLAHAEKSPRKCKTCGGISTKSMAGKPGKGSGGSSPGKQPGRGPGGDMACPDCGAGLDSMDRHMPHDTKKDDITKELIKAVEISAQMQGTVPAAIAGHLKQLLEPTLSYRDFINNCFMKKKAGEGMENDWKRFRRRRQGLYSPGANGKLEKKHEMLRPRTKTHDIKWVLLQDCSGSMSDDDIAFGLKEMRVIAGKFSGTIVPVDAKVYWDRATPITCVEDLQRTEIVGRGGTVFADFFKDLSKHECGREVDLVVVITDGYIDNIPEEYNPRCDVLWIITSKNEEFKPRFGRVTLLRGR